MYIYIYIYIYIYTFIRAARLLVDAALAEHRAHLKH